MPFHVWNGTMNIHRLGGIRSTSRRVCVGILAFGRLSTIASQLLRVLNLIKLLLLLFETSPPTIHSFVHISPTITE